MTVNFEVRSIADVKDLNKLRSFLLTQQLGYPNYDAWVEGVCIPDINHGWKHAILAYSEGKVIGDIVWQPHKELPRTRELKNMRIDSRLRNRDLGHFLIRQAEEEGKGSFERILCDTDAANKGIVQFLRFCGYSPLMQMPLYSPNRLELIMAKEFPSSDPYSLNPAHNIYKS